MTTTTNSQGWSITETTMARDIVAMHDAALRAVSTVSQAAFNEGTPFMEDDESPVAAALRGTGAALAWLNEYDSDLYSAAMRGDL